MQTLMTRNPDLISIATDDGWKYEAVRTQRATKEQRERWAVTRTSPEGGTENLKLVSTIEQGWNMAAAHEPQQQEFSEDSYDA